MTDAELLQQINALVDEEHALLEATERGDIDDDGEQRLHALELTIAQHWDLLRQRRALRRAGADPDQAQLRSPETIENYRQ